MTLAPDDPGDDAPALSTAPAGSVHADVGRALADGLARALAAGDNREARRILAALSALAADDAPAAAPVNGGAVVDLAAERCKRGER